MILKTKPYTVGCRAHLNAHYHDLRCGDENTFGSRSLCANCAIRDKANGLIELNARGKKL